MACTIKDVRDLNTKLLNDLTDELTSKLRAALRAELQAVGHTKQIKVSNGASGLPSKQGWASKAEACFNEVLSEEEVEAELAIKSRYIQFEHGIREHGQIMEDDVWRADFWASSDETDWLLSKPYGPEGVCQRVPPAGGFRLEIEEEEEEEEGYVSAHHGDMTSPFRFVEAGWFLKLSAFVIVVNTACTVIALRAPSMRASLYWPNQFMLTFYVFELVARICYFGGQYLRGPTSFIMGNILDMVVVVAGVVEQWVFTMFPDIVHGEIIQLLRVLKFLRLLRVLKLVNVLLRSDLSWTEEPAFQSFIGFVISVNACLIGLETDIRWSGWFWIEQVLLLIYVFELAVRLKRFGRAFISCDNHDFTWNLLDLTIVFSSILDSWIVPLWGLLMGRIIPHDGKDEPAESKHQAGMGVGQVMMLMRLLRLMRILRLAKLFKSIRPLYVLVESVCASIQGVVWVLLLTLTMLYAMGIFATRLIGQGLLFANPEDVDPAMTFPFKSVFDSMFTLFRLMSGSASSEESAAIDEVMKVVPMFRFAFVFFMVTSSWTLLSILTAVVSETMISTTGAQEYEVKLAHDEEDRKAHLQALRAVFAEVDTKHDGRVHWGEMLEFLRQGDNAFRTARMCRVPARDVVQVLKTLEETGEIISMPQFIDCLADVGKTVTEKSVMKLESRLKDVQRSLRTLCRALL